MKVLIVESPAKCRKIEDYLGHKCVASMGHINGFNTKSGISAIDITNDFSRLDFILSAKGRKQLAHIRRTIRENGIQKKDIIMATDDDREGEAIAWHLAKALKLNISGTTRILFNEITKPALQKAMAHPTHIDMDRVNAQLARQILDYLIGFTISPILWSIKRGLSAGRCQSPALRIIYENEISRRETEPQLNFKVEGLFNLTHSLIFNLEKPRIHSRETLNEFLNLSKTFKHELTEKSPRTERQSPPNPLNTSRLQQLSPFSPKITMSLCQKLYENGWITYMRTDSSHYAEVFINSAQEYILSKWGPTYMDERRCKSRIGKNGAHEAVRPTSITRINIPDSRTPQEQRMYRFIWETTIRSIMTDARFVCKDTIVSAPMDGIYNSVFKECVFPGHLILKKMEHIMKDEIAIRENERMTNYPVELEKITATPSMSLVPCHLSESQLVAKLEKSGIGRPSTFASLVEKIQTRKYVVKGDCDGETRDEEIFVMEREKGKYNVEITPTTCKYGDAKSKLLLTTLGETVMEYLLSNYPKYMEYRYTEQIENELDDIAKGTINWKEICRREKMNLIEPREKIEKDHNKKDKTQKKNMSDFSDEEPMPSFGKSMFGNITKPKLTKPKTTKPSQEDSFTPLEYKSEPIQVLSGKYGPYFKWNGANYSIKGKTDEQIDQMTIGEFERIIEARRAFNERKNKNGGRPPSVIRDYVLNSTIEISLRKSQHGKYIFVKRKGDMKPMFINLRNFKGDLETNADVFEFIRETKPELDVFLK
jgi:DNA topoisomerase-1